MEKNTQSPYIVILIFALLVLGGFYGVFIRVSDVRDTTKDLETRLSLLESKISAPIASPSNIPITNPFTTPTSSPVIATTSQETAKEVVPGIIITTKSDASLQPQTNLTITLEKIARSADGTMVLSLKVFTNEATSYTAIDPRSLFQIINLETENTQAIKVSAGFNSMPPKSSISGTMTFTTDITKTKIILQAGAGEATKYYELDFQNLTAKEIQLG